VRHHFLEDHHRPVVLAVRVRGTDHGTVGRQILETVVVRNQVLLANVAVVPPVHGDRLVGRIVGVDGQRGGRRTAERGAAGGVAERQREGLSVLDRGVVDDRYADRPEIRSHLMKK